MQQPSASPTERAPDDVRLRAIPHPYGAMLAICSDLDETPDRDVYWNVARFLNGRAETPMGRGLGLEVGNSLYFDMPPDQFAYWNTDDRGRRLAQELIRSGHLDCLHSYGDLATTRAHAARALEELERHGCRLKVWVDHAVAPSNLGADIMRGRGDVVGDAAYHADLTCGFGVEYVWRGRITSVIGQEVSRRLAGVGRARHPLASARTLAKEWLKGLLGRCGSAKYAIHAPNRVLRPVRLRDGRPVCEFLRANPYWGGVQHAASAAGLAEVLTGPFLRRLEERRGVCLLYTHLGKIRDARQPLPEATCRALRELAAHAADARVLVTTTRRVLDWCRGLRETRLKTRRHGVALCVDLERPAELPTDGLTLSVPSGLPVRVSLNGSELHGLQQGPGQDAGRQWLSLPWPRLEFPEP
jgi:hypothetical protein